MGTEAVPVHGPGAQGMEWVDAAVTATMKRYGIVGCGVCLSKGYQFAAVSNWNSAKSPFVDPYLSRALTRVLAKLEN